MAEDYFEIEPTILNRRQIAATGLGTSEQGIAAYESLQYAVFSGAPAAVDAVQAKADSAASDAAAAQAAATAATTAAANKVIKDAGPVFAAASGTVSRAAYPIYVSPTISDPPTAAQVQAIADALQALSRNHGAVVNDLRANHALTN